MNAAGTSLIYSTFLGGSGSGGITDEATGIAVNLSGSAYVTGGTGSTDFPIVNALQASLNGLEDAFVSKLNPTGSALVYSTYLGGSDFDIGNDIAVDSSGSAYLIGSTVSFDFPMVNAFQSTGSRYGATFLAKLNSAGSALVYSTFFGGSGVEYCEGIAVDAFGDAYLTGATCSEDFPTMNPIQATNNSKHGGASNAYIAKFNAAGSALLYSTYLGGSGVFFGEACPGGGDIARAISVDPTGVACVVGTTPSSDFPTVNALQAANNNTGYPPAYNAFVTCLNAAGSALAYSTYLGGNSNALANAIAVDSSGNAYLGGTTQGDFPTVNPIQAGYGGAFVVMISPPPAITFLPTSLSFGPVLGGTTSPAESVTLTPISNASVSLTSITASGDFAVVSYACPFGSTCVTSCPDSGGSLSAGTVCAINVTFTPTNTGTRTGTLTITYTGAGSPETIALSGTGTAPAATLSSHESDLQRPDGGNRKRFPKL